MRQGTNPAKIIALNKEKYYHKIIVPVWITDDIYFKNSFEVLKLSLSSLLQTIHERTTITIVVNDSLKKVVNYLMVLLEEKKINNVVLNSTNEGKVDPTVKIMRVSEEELITVADCDVLYKVGWQQAVEEIFFTFPRVGRVTPLPQPRSWNQYTNWTWVFGLLKGKIFRMKNYDLNSTITFNKSIWGEPNLVYDELNPFYLKYKNQICAIGGNHFCATYSREFSQCIPKRSSGTFFNGAEKDFLDKPLESYGFLNLATQYGYVYHMGNTQEKWMYEVLEENEALLKNNNCISHIEGFTVKSNDLLALLAKSALGKLLIRFLRTRIVRRAKCYLGK